MEKGIKLYKLSVRCENKQKPVGIKRQRVLIYPDLDRETMGGG